MGPFRPMKGFARLVVSRHRTPPCAVVLAGGARVDARARTDPEGSGGGATRVPGGSAGSLAKPASSGEPAPDPAAPSMPHPAPSMAPVGGSDAAAIATRIEGVYTTYQREIFSFALHLTHDAAAAEDLTEEAFIRLLDEMRQRVAPDDPRAWLYRVLSNLVISGGRRRSVAERWKPAIAVRDETDRSPEAIAIRRERCDGVQAALDGLRVDARTALLLAAAGFTGHEVACAIGRTDAATRTLLCRARAELRTRLERPGVE